MIGFADRAHAGIRRGLRRDLRADAGRIARRDGDAREALLA